MYILYNTDGSVLKKNLTDYIQKGNNDVNAIFVAIDGYENDEWNLVALFELPNGDLSSETPTTENSYEIDGETYSGWVVPITAAETIYEGILKLSLQVSDIQDNPHILFTTTIKLVINPAVAEPDETTITYAQYLTLLALINQKTTQINSIAVISNISVDITGFANGQIFYAITQNAFYKKQNNTLIEIDIDDIDAKLATKQNTLVFDNTPTSGSQNPVTSGGIYTTFNNYYTKQQSDIRYISSSASQISGTKTFIDGIYVDYYFGTFAGITFLTGDSESPGLAGRLHPRSDNVSRLNYLDAGENGHDLAYLEDLGEKVPSAPSSGVYGLRSTNGTLNWIESAGSTLVTSGVFSNGEIAININQVTFTPGVYLFTYGNVQAFLFLTAEMISAATTSPIRTAMPVVYGIQGQTDPGSLKLTLSGTTLTVRVANQMNHVRDGFTLYIYKTNIV